MLGIKGYATIISDEAHICNLEERMKKTIFLMSCCNIFGY